MSCQVSTRFLVRVRGAESWEVLSWRTLLKTLVHSHHGSQSTQNRGSAAMDYIWYLLLELSQYGTVHVISRTHPTKFDETD